MASQFELKYKEWLQANIDDENNLRRLELLNKGLGYGTVEFLRSVWFPAVGHFDHLLPEFFNVCSIEDIRNNMARGSSGSNPYWISNGLLRSSHCLISLQPEKASFAR